MGTAQWFLPQADPISLTSPKSRACLKIAGAVAIAAALGVFAVSWQTDSDLMQKTPRAEMRGPDAPSTPVTSQVSGTDEITPSQTTVVVPLEYDSGGSNPSVARTDEDLIAMERDGKRHITEFNLQTSRRFQSIAGLQIGVWRTDARHEKCQLTFVSDGKQERRELRLFHPMTVWIGGKPADFVVNAIGKDSITGYLSEPKQTASVERTSYSVQR